MGTLKLKTPSGGSVAFTASEDSPLDTVVLVPVGNATMVTDEALASSSGASLIGVTPVGLLTATDLQAIIVQIEAYIAAHP